ncbi:hypothetical protein Q3V23_23245 [Streptomyces sp. VNUA116]|uniref:hypothetical protein n=1 Tax=Streptomyces sp. VNUA116 TaxID=3062449 RepID=UPI002676ACB5|nr:hypothetical protein [Streptomyces sp. VNUA116]WKU46741.1 hypothetical protein Q3V23_23245 [Streptomyces sp. VNUA116]
MIAGRGPSPALVLLLIARLPDTSLTTALAAGGRQFFGWGQDRHMQADLYDALTTNTRATGQWRGKAPKIPEYPRPQAPKKAPGKRGSSVAELYQHFSRR